jgi:hypothetical protein
MQAIDTTLAGNMKTLAQLSLAFGVPSIAFSLKYFYDFYFATIELPAVTYMLPIGAVFIFISLILAPAVYKIKIPSLGSWIFRGLKASQLSASEKMISKTLRRVLFIKFIRIFIFCFHQFVFILLAAAILQCWIN